MEHTVTMEDVQDRTLDDLLHEIFRTQETLTVVLAEGQAVEIRPTAVLKPLRRLEGYVPSGWKEALYGE